MATPSVETLVGISPISCFAFNGDRTQVAISPSSHELFIFEKKGGKWEKIHTLVEHDQRVLGVDWAPKTNLIVTCGEDRNAYVWKLEDNKWKPGLVVLRINRAATCVKWSPSEEKFAIGSGARIVSVCHFQEEHDWWVAKHIKSGIRSTVTSIDWHPNSTMLAVGCSDFQARVYAAAIKGVDKRPEGTSWAEASKFRSFGALLHSFTTAADGWVHDVAFSPSGNTLAWVSHSSSISFVDGGAVDSVTTIYESALPKRAVLFVAEDAVIAAGHDCMPVLYKNAGGWKMEKNLDEGKKAADSGVASAMSRFKQMDRQAQSSSNDVNLSTTHQNAINRLSALTQSGGNVSEFVTSGLDGKLVTWKL